MVKFIVISTLIMLYLVIAFLITFVKLYQHKQKGDIVKPSMFIKGILFPFTKYTNEYNIVFLKESLNGIPANTKGTIVHIYPDNKTYEVEFILSDGSSKVETINRSQLK